MDTIQAMAGESDLGGISSGVGVAAGKAFRYSNPEVVKEHIQKIMHDNASDKVIEGIENLKQATKLPIDGSNAQLRQGQIIFGTATVARALGKELNNPHWGYLFKLLEPVFLKIATGEDRKFAYMHVAVYAGMWKGKHFVIHNGGPNSKWDNNLGMISAAPIEEAFDKEGSFFIMSPPKDSKGETTRYTVLERALACLGTFYDYDIRAVSCEVFAMTMLKLEPTFDPIQVEVVKPLRKPL